MDTTQEIWKDIKGWESLYSISNTGKVFSKQTNKILTPVLKTTGYYCVDLCNNGIKKKYTIHRLVARHFVSNPNPSEYVIVNHKDENKLNNNANNLEWCTIQYNNTYGTAIERRKATYNNKSEEEKQAIINKRLITYFNMDPERRKIMIERLRKASTDFWANMSEDEYIDYCAKIALGLSKRTPEEKALQYKHIQEAWFNKDEATKQAFRESQSKITQAFWDSKDEEYRRQWGQKSKEIWEAKSDEEKDAFRDKMSTVNKENWENKTEESKEAFAKQMSDIWKNKSEERMKEYGDLQSKLNRERWDNKSEEQKELERERARQNGYMCSIMSQLKRNFESLCNTPFNSNNTYETDCGSFLNPTSILTMNINENKKVFMVLLC